MIAIATEDGVGTPEAHGVSELGGHAVSALAAAGEDLWALVDQAAVWRRRDEWAEVAADTTPAALPAALGRRRARGNGRGAPGPGRPRRGGAGRRLRAGARPRTGSPPGADPAVRTIAAGAEGELYVNVHVGGILRSDDDGASWRPTIDIRSDVHEVLAAPGRPALCWRPPASARRPARTAARRGRSPTTGSRGATAGPWRSPGTRCC